MNVKIHRLNDELSASHYCNQRVALLTKHGKEDVIAPTLKKLLGCSVEKVAGFDTDIFGTFTRDVARDGNQLEAARKKARTGMTLSGLPIGLASEGTFGPDPFAFMLPYNNELLIWIDDRLGIEVVATWSGKTNFAHQVVNSWADAEAFAKSAGFPEHHLIVRPKDENHPEFRKGLRDWSSLQEAVAWAMDLDPNRQAFIETDMRASVNPTRMENIRLAAEELARRLNSHCPSCDAPGFGKAGIIRGLPCEDCGLPTEEAKADIHRCVRCEHQSVVDRERRFAAARYCGYCNP